MANEEDEIDASAFGDMITNRFSVSYPNEAFEQFRGRVSSAMISLGAHIKHLDQEIKALKAAKPEGIDAGVYDNPTTAPTTNPATPASGVGSDVVYEGPTFDSVRTHGTVSDLDARPRDADGNLI